MLRSSPTPRSAMSPPRGPRANRPRALQDGRYQGHHPGRPLHPDIWCYPKHLVCPRQHARQPRLPGNRPSSSRPKATKNIFVIGDAGNFQEPQGKHADDRVVHVVKILEALSCRQSTPGVPAGGKIMFGASVSKNKGTGQMGSGSCGHSWSRTSSPSTLEPITRPTLSRDQDAGPEGLGVNGK